MLSLSAKLRTRKQRSENSSIPSRTTCRCGENLATGKEVAASAWMWFTEYLQGNHDFASFNHDIGHFQAMVWKSVKTIGCGVGPHDGGDGVVRCQYSSGS